MTNLELNDVQTEALIRELDEIVRNERYFLSPRIVVLKKILATIGPEPECRCRHYAITSRRARDARRQR